MADWIQSIRARHTHPGPAGRFGAGVADPLWLLARQWTMGERRGHDGGYAIRARYRERRVPLDPIAGHDPVETPLEPIFEGAETDIWTPSARIRAGRRVAAARPDLAARTDLMLSGLPIPYEHLDGTSLDGAALWRRREELGLAESDFGIAAPQRPDFYDPASFAHDVSASAGPVMLRAERHRGGSVDWYSFDRADGPGAPSAAPAPGLPDPDATQAPRHVFTRRVDLPGAPRSGWFALGDLDADFAAGGVEPGRDGLADYLTLASHARNWLTVPIDATGGAVLRVAEMTLIDSFGYETATRSPGQNAPRAFATTGLGADHILLAVAAPEPLTGPEQDIVDVAPDEVANLVWAVERRAGGRDRPAAEPEAPPATAPARLGGAETATYRRRSPQRPRFLAYAPDPDGAAGAWLVQSEFREADDTIRRAATALFSDPEPGMPHRIRRGAAPPLGITVVSRYRLVRATDGRPILWLERRVRRPSIRPQRAFRFDEVIAD